MKGTFEFPVGESKPESPRAIIWSLLFKICHWDLDVFLDDAENLNNAHRDEAIKDTLLEMARTLTIGYRVFLATSFFVSGIFLHITISVWWHYEMFSRPSTPRNIRENLRASVNLSCSQHQLYGFLNLIYLVVTESELWTGVSVPSSTHVTALYHTGNRNNKSSTHDSFSHIHTNTFQVRK